MRAVARFQRGGQPVYYLVNRTDQPIKAEVRAPAAAKVKVFNPTTGNIAELALPTVLDLGGFRSVVVLP